MTQYFYTTQEGGEWIPLEADELQLPVIDKKYNYSDLGTIPKSIEINFILNGESHTLTIHSITSDIIYGDRWDVINGWNKSLLRDK